MGSLGLFYSLIQARITRAYRAYPWRMRFLFYGVAASVPIILLFFGDHLIAQVYATIVIILVCTVGFPIVLGFLVLNDNDKRN